ncbi:class I SAM-dependent methyltransferase [Endothiovibrio diazotrophicus]
MLSGRRRVLEIGCGDAFGTRLVQQEVDQLSATDFDSVFIEDVKDRMVDRWDFSVFQHDILAAPLEGDYDGMFALDVLEHISPEDEDSFLTNSLHALADNGVMVVGMPTLESQQYASATSRAGHVNCKDLPSLKGVMGRYFEYVFMFSMNDEVVHTGFHKMAHYIMALCAGVKR